MTIVKVYLIVLSSLTMGDGVEVSAQHAFHVAEGQSKCESVSRGFNSHKVRQLFRDQFGTNVVATYCESQSETIEQE